MKPKPSSQDQEIIEILKELASRKAAYPEELLAARRAAFLEQLEQPEQAELHEGLSSQDQEVVQHLRRLEAIAPKYPPTLLAARRSAFRRQIAEASRFSLVRILRLAVSNLFPAAAQMPRMSFDVLRTSLIVASFAFAAWVGFVVFGNRGVNSTFSPAHGELPIYDSIVATNTQEIICPPGYEPPLCLAKPFAEKQDLTYQGNGTARPAVAKDALPGAGGVHRAAYVNDGQYGPGASWISNSPNSWIKIDLGKTTTINTVAFGKDRLGQLIDRNPGQFTISVALSDDVYADGNSSNDDREYAQVFSSKQAGFNGIVLGTETVVAQFKPHSARYLKITFEKAGAAVDEVEAFMLPTPVQSTHLAKIPSDKLPLVTATALSTYTSLPTRPPTGLPTSTSLPTQTATPLPTSTPYPTDTETPVPTDTPLPTDTPAPTDTPVPTDTAVPAPTDTPLPTDTVAPTDTPYPIPTLTAAPSDSATTNSHGKKKDIPVEHPLP